MKYNRIMIVATVAVLAACNGNVKENLGLQKNAPDEFRVISKPPLVIPPNFNLRPPHEGDSPLTQSTAREDARDVLLSTTGKTAQTSASTDRGEEVLLNKVGTDEADPNIRAALRAEQQQHAPEAEKPGFFKRMLSKKTQEKPDPIVDAKGESKRIRDNIKQDKPITKGETPTVTPKQGILQNIFSRNSE